MTFIRRTAVQILGLLIEDSSDKPPPFMQGKSWSCSASFRQRCGPRIISTKTSESSDSKRRCCTELGTSASEKSTGRFTFCGWVWVTWISFCLFACDMCIIVATSVRFLLIIYGCFIWYCWYITVILTHWRSKQLFHFILSSFLLVELLLSCCMKSNTFLYSLVKNGIFCLPRFQCPTATAFLMRIWTYSCRWHQGGGGGGEKTICRLVLVLWIWIVPKFSSQLGFIQSFILLRAIYWMLKKSLEIRINKP